MIIPEVIALLKTSPVARLEVLKSLLNEFPGKGFCSAIGRTVSNLYADKLYHGYARSSLFHVVSCRVMEIFPEIAKQAPSYFTSRNILFGYWFLPLGLTADRLAILKTAIKDLENQIQQQ